MFIYKKGNTPIAINTLVTLLCTIPLCIFLPKTETQGRRKLFPRELPSFFPPGVSFLAKIRTGTQTRNMVL